MDGRIDRYHGVCFVDGVSAPLRSSDPLRAEVSSHTLLSFSCSREHLLESVCVWGGGVTAGCHVDGGNHGYTGVTSNSLCVILPQSQREHETFIRVFRLLIFITHSFSLVLLSSVSVCNRHGHEDPPVPPASRPPPPPGTTHSLQPQINYFTQNYSSN